VGERGIRPEPDHRVLDVIVAVEDVDVRGTRPVGLADERASELGVLHHRNDRDLLPRLHVRPHADGKLGVALEPLLVHVSCHSSSRITGTTVPSGSIASISTSGPPTMKSMCVFATLNPSSGSPST